MKKYILFIGLCSLALIQLGASEKIKGDLPQDSINGKGRFNIEIPNIEIPDMDLDFDALNFDYKFDFDFDTAQWLAWKEDFEKSGVKNLKELERNLKVNKERLSELGKNLKSRSNNDNLSVFSNNQKGKTPDRVETKTYSNISEIDISHKYGNIFVRESRSKNVELEIQYFNKLNRRNPVRISEDKGVLAIASLGSSVNQIDLVISIPRNVKLNVDLKYGRLKMNEFNAPFSANLSYSTFDAESFSGARPTIKDKYGKVTISKLQDAVLSTSYSKVKIDKANRLDLSGAYSDFVLNDVQTISAQLSSTSGDFKIGSLGEMDGKFNYADISIDNLRSRMNVICNYSDVKVNSISPNTNINVKGNYSDVVLSVPDNVGASFNVVLVQGDMTVSKKYTVKYTEQTETSTTVIKKGQIGTKRPTATITVSSNYADVKIK